MNNKKKTTELLSNLSKDVNQLIGICNHYFLSQDKEIINLKHPEEDWSIADCIEHLNEFCAYYIPRMEQIVDAGLQQGIPAEESFSSNQMGFEAIMSVHPQNLPTMQTIGHFKDRDIGGANNHKVIEEYVDFQNRLLLILDKSNKTSLTKLEVPVRNKDEWKLQLGDCLQYLIAHQILHNLQAIKLHEQLSPPINPTV